MSQLRTAICPSCQRTGQFQFSGNQQCPAEVAARLGLPTIIPLWTCPACHSTISEPDLKPGGEREKLPPTNRRTKHVRSPLTIVSIHPNGDTPRQTVTW